jgi:hypothetical protein
MQLLSEPEEQGLELLLVLLSKDSKLLAFPNCFPPDHTLLQHKVALMLL